MLYRALFHKNVSSITYLFNLNHIREIRCVNDDTYNRNHELFIFHSDTRKEFSQLYYENREMMRKEVENILKTANENSKRT